MALQSPLARLPLAGICCCVLSGCVSLAHAEDWARFRGSDGSAVASPAEQPPLKWSDTENVIWRTALPGQGSSSPAVFKGRIYLTAFTGYALDVDSPGDKSRLELHTLCFDRTNGGVLWNQSIAANPAEQDVTRRVADHGYATGTPAVDDTGVYTYFGVSGVAAYTLEGQLKWQAATGDKTAGFGSASSPVLYGDLVIVNASIECGAVIAFDKLTGKQRWRIDEVKRSWTTPLVALNSDGKPELIVSYEQVVAGHNPATGERLWTCKGIQDYVVPCVVAHQGVAYVLGGRKNQSMAIRLGGRGDVTDSHKLWENNIGANVTSPVVHEGRLYWCSDREVACCLNAQDGSEVYRQRLTLTNSVYASVVLAADRLYMTTRDAGVLVAGLGDEFKELAVNKLSDEGMFNASPAVSDSQLFLRTNGFLYCIGHKP